MADSKSSLNSTPFTDRVREWLALARLSISDSGNRDFSDLENSYLDHDSYARRYVGRPLTSCKVVEIGYGARPTRLIWFYGRGVDITGIDLDQPILYGKLSEFGLAYRKNGWERALKSMARWFINERRQRKHMLTELSERKGETVELPVDRLVVGDASSVEFWDRQRGANYIFSEDVFEHIPTETLEALLPRMAASMDKDGVACVKPMVFTGICGGHQLEWYPHTFDQPMERLTEPWEHLRKNRHAANTHLNKLTLADYRRLFSKHFEILEETAERPDLGRQFMTDEIREELRAYGDDELFSNGMIFLLRPLRG